MLILDEKMEDGWCLSRIGNYCKKDFPLNKIFLYRQKAVLVFSFQTLIAACSMSVYFLYADVHRWTVLIFT